MDPGSHRNVAGQQSHATAANEVVLPVSVEDGVDQVVFSLDDGLMANDQTTYIIQFVDSDGSITSSSIQQETPVSASELVSGVGNAVHATSTQDLAIQHTVNPETQPILIQPSTHQPGSQQPGKQLTVSQQLATQQPGTHQPVVTQRLIIQEPATQKRVIQQLDNQPPGTQQLANQQPGTQHLVIHRPVTQKLVSQQSVKPQLTHQQTNQPLVTPVTQKLFAQQSVTHQPVLQQPVSHQPANPQAASVASVSVQTMTDIITTKNTGKPDKTKEEQQKLIKEEQKKTDLRKALNLRTSSDVTEKKSDEQTHRKMSDSQIDATESLVSNMQSSRTMTRRNIRKPKRFEDASEVEIKEREPIYLTLPKITKKRLGLQDMCIEFEVEEKLCVGALEKLESVDGFCKYSVRISRNPVKIDVESAVVFQDDQSDSLEETKEAEVSKKTSALKVKKEKSAEKIEDDAETTDKTGAKRGRKKKTKSIKASKRIKLDESSESFAEDGAPVVNDEREDSKDKLNAQVVVTESQSVRASVNKSTNINEYDDADNIRNSDSSSNLDDKTIIKNKGKKKIAKVEDTKNTLEEIADEKEVANSKPKRKYTKRRAYNRDDLNYTVKKSETGGKQFICNICEKDCKSEANMVDHLHVHSSERPVICENCGMSFKSVKALKRHSVRHTDKSFICDTCGALFCSGADLKSHTRVHFNKREYVCKTCGKGFNHSTTLSRHKQVHNKNRNGHVCHMCGAIFRRKDGVSRHVANIHGVEVKTGDYKTDVKCWFRNKRENALQNSGISLKKSKPVSKPVSDYEQSEAVHVPTHATSAEHWATYEATPVQSVPAERADYYSVGSAPCQFVNESNSDHMYSDSVSDHQYTGIRKKDMLYHGHAVNPIAQEVEPRMYSEPMVQPQMLEETSGVCAPNSGETQYIELQAGSRVQVQTELAKQELWGKIHRY